MGLYTIDNVNREERARKQARRDELRKWLILLAELGAMAGTVIMLIWLVRWLGI